ncbi:hypothetical protein KIN20_028013 [Parelaphostrongylus tenuis]|uniref:Uncharacterized protein n=1 Tax=Parelaphostrongylus tenuis TaxID=148309 RepID=A0AAD5R072_PARTN|nr:hypothetical protein KIN20_028013 [Parelaphostrongylus tenuis]
MTTRSANRSSDARFLRRHARRKRREASKEEDWEAFEDEDLETMLQGLVVSADEDTSNESDASMDKNVHTPLDSEDDDDGTGDAQRALFNLDIVDSDWTTNEQPPTVLSFDGLAAGVQHSIVTGCRQPSHLHELLMTNLWELIQSRHSSMGLR